MAKGRSCCELKRKLIRDENLKMQPTMEVLARISENSGEHHEEVFTRLYRYLLRPDLYFEAYRHLYANKGAATKGVDNDTVDGFSEEKIAKIVASLADDSYTPKPVRRTYIQKKNGKMRPLGIPTFTDKLVQETLRMVLEAVYEPIFLNCSHGFRPKRSCHTALSSLKKEFTGARWFVEGDIKGCFDNIDHSALVGFIGNKIKDARIIKLIYKFLKAGYLENWQYNKTYSGTPQGGIISPLLANIYLHELDKFVMKLKLEFDKPRTSYNTHEYEVLNRRLHSLRKSIDKADGKRREELLGEYKTIRAEMLKTPAKSQTDKKLKYIRYADDFIISVNGNREDCVEIKRRLAEFIGETLKMELSDEKTLITHSSEYARFLGYDVRVRRNAKIKPSRGVTKRTLNNKTELNVPFVDKIQTFLFAKGVIKQKENGTIYPTHRPALERLTDLEIVMTYNAELRGICNYYGLASNFGELDYFAYLMEYSCLRTLAGKHKSKVTKIIKRFSDGHGKWGIPYETAKGAKRCYFAKFGDCKGVSEVSDVIGNTAAMYTSTRNTLENRLKAKKCELCGIETADHYEVHHVNKVKDLKGKADWERAMIAKRRKTLIVCRNCHCNIHNRKPY
jgi:group II intron reverse transcriptase/maturase